MELAKCDDTWNAIVSSEKSEFIRTKDDLDAVNFGKLLPEVSTDDIEKFKETIAFRVEKISDGDGKEVAVKKGVSTFSVEIFVTKYKFDPDKIEKIGELFGIGPERFWKRYHYFGDVYPTPHCNPRPYYNCPW